VITCSHCACLSGKAPIHLVKYYVVARIKLCPTEDGGLIIQMKSNPHFEKGKSSRIGCKGIEEKFYLPAKF
jgi:hypothetical protein